MAVVINFLLGLVVLVSTWRVFTKAGRPGWAAIVPIYNLVVLCQIADRPAWQGVVLFFSGTLTRLVILFVDPGNLAALPIAMALAGVTLGLWLLASYALAGKFGKSRAFAIGLIVLPFVFFPILAFGDAKYEDDSDEMQVFFRLSR